MAEIEKRKIDELIPDDKNFNKGTEYGSQLLEKSIRQFGAGRSILIDKNGKIIAGNKTVEQATAIGMDDVIVVKTNGNQIVAVQRTDIDLDTKKGREMALADNATGKANLEWDEDVLSDVALDLDINPLEWGVKIDVMPDTSEEPEEKEKPFVAKITFTDPRKMSAFADRFMKIIKEEYDGILSISGGEL